MNTLLYLLNKTSDSKKQELLLSCMNYKTTTDITQTSVPILTLKISFGQSDPTKPYCLPWEEIKQHIEKYHSNIVAKNFVQELQQVLPTLEQVEQDAALHMFDCIQVCKSGICLLRIIIDGNKVNRSACIEINDYKRVLQDYITHRYDGWKNLFSSAVYLFCTSLCTAFTVLVALDKIQALLDQM
jgi:hypothetical protein